jgi:hypothetical protein
MSDHHILEEFQALCMAAGVVDGLQKLKLPPAAGVTL